MAQKIDLAQLSLEDFLTGTKLLHVVIIHPFVFLQVYTNIV